MNARQKRHRESVELKYEIEKKNLVHRPDEKECEIRDQCVVFFLSFGDDVASFELNAVSDIGKKEMNIFLYEYSD